MMISFPILFNGRYNDPTYKQSGSRGYAQKTTQSLRRQEGKQLTFLSNWYIDV